VKIVAASTLILPVPVLILEDDALVQSRLKEIMIELGYEESMLIFASSLKSAYQRFDEHPISFAMVDLGLPDGSGISLIEKIREQDAGLPILVISAWSTEDMILQAILAGATGYVLKERDDFEIALSIRSLLRGGAPIDPFIAQKILAQLGVKKISIAGTEQSILTERELEILNWVAQGLSNKEIALRLNISRYTIESHIKHIYRKLSVTTRTKAINAARDLGIL
jgi:DNA-binding NarL/FixJ family response regulator